MYEARNIPVSVTVSVLFGMTVSVTDSRKDSGLSGTKIEYNVHCVII